MTPYEIMLSESQERMLLVCRRDRLPEVLAIFHKWELDAVEIGRVTGTGRGVLLFCGGEEGRPSPRRAARGASAGLRPPAASRRRPAASAVAGRARALRSRRVP